MDESSETITHETSNVLYISIYTQTAIESLLPTSFLHYLVTRCKWIQRWNLWSFFYLRNDLPLMAFQCARKLYMFLGLRVYSGSWWRKRFNNLQNTFDHWQTVSHAELEKKKLWIYFLKIFDATFIRNIFLYFVIIKHFLFQNFENNMFS